MKNCPNCHSQAKDDALFCPVCGTMLDVVPQPDPDYFQMKNQPAPVTVPVIKVSNTYDHTNDYCTDDIREARLPCMCTYLLDFVGVIITLLMCPNSKYAQFHIRQSLKFTIVEILIALASVLLFWTFIIPIAGIIALVALCILKLICFTDVCKRRAKDAPILRNIKFLN